MPSFIVKKPKLLGKDTYYVLLFLRDRLLFVKLDARLGELGGIGQFFYPHIFFKSSIVSLKKERDKMITELSRLTVDELLKLDEANFEILYTEISEISLLHTDDWEGIQGFAITGKRIYSCLIASYQDFDECKKIVMTFLPHKISNAK